MPPTHDAESGSYKRPKNAPRSLFDPAIVKRAIADAFRKLDPRLVAKNPVMFVVEVGSRRDHVSVHQGPGAHGGHDLLFTGQITLWLWFTVIFANFAEAMAEGRGKAQAEALRKTKTETMARKLVDGNREEQRARNPASQGRHGRLRGGRDDSRRRRGHRGDRLRGRVGHHRRIAPRSSARAAATAARSPAAPKSFRTGSSSGSHPTPARLSSTE